MTKALRILAALLLVFPVFAQAQRTYSQPELDQMLAPVALYPDALLSQVLMAATYPVEVVEAARWSRANPGLQGDDAVRAAQSEDWDPSVKSLLAFPQLLARMDENLDWTRRLGEAFLGQEPQVMDTVQQLRRRAQAAGNLQSSEHMHVQQQGQVILVQPASPRNVYIPYYDPLVVYGPWWWPSYQPLVWAPWPGYVRPYQPGISVTFWWGRPVGLPLNFFFGDFDWHRRHVRVVHASSYYYRPPVVVNRTVVVERGRWEHDPHHRRGMHYRAPEVQQRFANTPVERRATRQEKRRFESQAAPAAVQAQPAVRIQPQPQVQSRAQHQPAAQPRAVQAQSQAHVQPVVRPQPQVRHEQRARMPEAVAPQLPRAERQERRQERRETRQEQRQERGQKG